MTPIREPQRFFSYGLLITAALIFVSYRWFDIPLVQTAYDYQWRQYTWLDPLQAYPKYFAELAFILVLGIGVSSCWRIVSRLESALMYASLSYILSSFLTKIAKMIFARTWPATWTENNISFLHDGVYGFFWFTDGPAYRSFPSGHTSAVFAVAFTLGAFYPKLWGYFLLACLLVVVGLVGNYYHFLSDIIAGAYLGIASAVLIAQLSTLVQD